jgi:hypothetical protein
MVRDGQSRQVAEIMFDKWDRIGYVAETNAIVQKRSIECMPGRVHIDHFISRKSPEIPTRDGQGHCDSDPRRDGPAETGATSCQLRLRESVTQDDPRPMIA